MAGLHSSDFMKFVHMAGHSSGFICTSLYNMAGLHSSGFIKFVQYGWITQ